VALRQRVELIAAPALLHDDPRYLMDRRCRCLAVLRLLLLSLHEFCQARWSRRTVGDDEGTPTTNSATVCTPRTISSIPPWFASVTSIGGNISPQASPAKPATAQTEVADVRSWSQNRLVAITAGIGECER
jgi:hypothetical protein